jgi:pyruvate dehydrogenase E1 component alpha subunit/2-oxoisovalerate dehydrogenase E1 component alpha subunit
MILSIASDAPPERPASLREEVLVAFRFMLLARLADEKMASLYRAGKIYGGVFLGRGQEALSVALGKALRRGDVFAPLIRDWAGRLAFGEPLLDGIRTYMGSSLGPTRGRDGNVHRGRPKEGLLPMISHLGAMMSVVNGALMAKRFQGETGRAGGVCLGDGATSTGAFHEALNQAAIERLPLVVVVANNQYAYSTPTSRQFACRDLVDRAEGYGVEGSSVDGTELLDCLEIVGAAVARARAGGGPQLVVASLLRLCGHGEHDDCSYIDPALKALPMGRDCLKVAERAILERGWADSGAIDEIRRSTHAAVEEAAGMAQREPAPDPYREEWRAISTLALVDGGQSGAPD